MAKSKSSQEYWFDRMKEIVEYVDNMDVDFMLELQSIYNEHSQEALKDLYAFYGRYAQDNAITLQEAKKRLSGVDLSDYRDNAKKYRESFDKDPDLLKWLNEQYASSNVTKLDALRLDIAYRLGQLHQATELTFYGYVRDVARYVYKKIKFGNTPSTLSAHVLEEIISRPWNGYNYSEALWGNTLHLAADLKKVFERGFVRGSSVVDMARELARRYSVATSHAQTLIRTDGSSVINNATAKRFEEAGLTEYEFKAHLDGRTTHECRDLDGKIFKLKDYQPGTNAPPMQYNCRSIILPTKKELEYV